jgi:dihydropteroate synthase
MGVLNVTPDSFSDGARYCDVDAAVAHAHAMAAAGADLIDIGGESTRPGAARVDAAQQLRRLMPVLERLQRGFDTLLSIDTTRAAVAAAALDGGAYVVNDISGGRDDSDMLPLVAQRGVPVILMHMRGEPATMQDAPAYDDVMAQVGAFLRERLALARSVGIDTDRVLLDPGIGFGKTAGHNLTLIHRLRELTALGRPLVLGTSRKGFIGRIAGENDPADRVMGTAASVAWCVANGADIARVHDVGPIARVVRVIRAILCESSTEF